MAEIVLDGVTKRFADGFEAVKKMSLDVADGEFIILVGPSGCGKSTALRMIAGLEDITEGELKIGDRVVNQLAPKERDIAMVFQNYALYPAHDRAREHGLPAEARQGSAGGDRPEGRRGRKHPGPHRAPRSQAGEPLRRPAPAGGDGPGDRPRPEGVPDGRAALQPRREAARAVAHRGGPHPVRGWARRPSTSPTTRPRR